MSNPYLPNSGRTVRRVLTSARDVPAHSEDGLRGGTRGKLSALPAFNGAGEINASSKRDAMQQIAQIMDAASSGTTLSVMSPEEQKERTAALVEAFYDKSEAGMARLGEVFSEEIWTSLGREGFSRKLFAVQNVQNGAPARVKIRQKDVIAWQVTADNYVQENRVRQNWVYPPEFYLICHILIEDKEIAQASSDLLDEKFQDGLEAILRTEDKISHALLSGASTTYNDATYFSSFTPSVLAQMRTNVMRWGVPATTALISVDIWNDILSNAEFGAWFDPVTKHELIMEGRIGSILGVEFVTDGLRTANLQVLKPGEVFVTGAPITLGTIVQRKALDSHAINKYPEGRPARGWFLEQIQAQVLVNSRSVSKGLRM